MIHASLFHKESGFVRKMAVSRAGHVPLRDKVWDVSVGRVPLWDSILRGTCPARDRVSRAGDAGENPALGGGDIGESPTVGECQTNVYRLQIKDVRFRLENGDSNTRIHTIRNSSVNYYP